LKANDQMLYLIGFNIKPEVYIAKTMMDVNKAHEKLGHVGENILCKTINLPCLINWKIACMQWVHTCQGLH